VPAKPRPNRKSASAAHLRQLTATLRGNLEKCASDPDIDPVHDLRTGTRRVQAMVEALLRERSDPALQEAADRWLTLLKKLRRAAAPVRDLDVHRKLLRKLVKYGGDHTGAGEIVKTSTGVVTGPSPDVVEAPATALPVSAVEQQADHLDAWLHHARQHQATGLKKKAAKWLTKFDEEAAALEAVMTAPGHRTCNAADVALKAFARLAHEMPHLSAENLHDFRKGAKKARYIAESAQDDTYAQTVAKALKKLQDDIGDWHDWLVLAEEAHTALDKHGQELMDLIANERDRHLVLAMKTVQRLRGKLLGEYLAMAQSKRKGHPGAGMP
jgi:CHAD domain-containing protein